MRKQPFIKAPSAAFLTEASRPVPGFIPEFDTHHAVIGLTVAEPDDVHFIHQLDAYSLLRFKTGNWFRIDRSMDDIVQAIRHDEHMPVRELSAARESPNIVASTLAFLNRRPRIGMIDMTDALETPLTWTFHPSDLARGMEAQASLAQCLKDPSSSIQVGRVFESEYTMVQRHLAASFTAQTPDEKRVQDMALAL
jgi:hypothetical protein